jgi:acyl carrier protein
LPNTLVKGVTKDLTKAICGIVQVTAEVRAMVGHSIHPEEPLMSAGLDSRGGMELRRALGETLGLDLPVTLLYDYQSILAIVTYINTLIEAQAQAQAHAADGVEAEAYWSDEQEEEGRAGPARRGVATLAEAAAEKPSKLLKTLRYDMQCSTCWCSLSL